MKTLLDELTVARLWTRHASDDSWNMTCAIRVVRRCVAAFLGAGMILASIATGHAQTPPPSNDKHIVELLETVRLKAIAAGNPTAAAALVEQPRFTQTAEGYLQSISAGPGREFPTVAGAAGDPEGAAKVFIKKNGTLFGATSPAVDFKLRKKNSGKGRHSMRMTQTYAGIPVFGGEMVLQVNDTGGVEHVSSNFDRDTSDLDQKRLSTEPKLTKDQARAAARAHYAEAAAGQALAVTPPELTLFVPALLKMNGPKRLAWKMEVRSATETTVAKLVFIDAHSGEFVQDIALIHEALNRNIYDGANTSTTTLVRSEGGPPSGVVDANSAYAYLGDTYNFYFNHFGRNGIANNGAALLGYVRYCRADGLDGCPMQNA